VCSKSHVDTNDKKLLAALEIELKEHNDDPVLWELVGALEERLNKHRHDNLKRKYQYKILGYVLTLLIPCYSAILTWVASVSNHPLFANHIGLLGLFLTILTIINSGLKPSEKYITASHILVSLHDWEMDFVINFHIKIQNKNERDKLYEWLLQKDKALSKIGSEIVDRILALDIKTSVPRSKTPHKPHLSGKETPVNGTSSSSS
jgi:hypothetical protein